MLREVIADVVVGRARELAALADPADAFIAEHRWKTGDYTRVVHEFTAELTGFEIVVACATNTAAENISIEIPGIDAIDPRRRSTIDYYPRLASRLLATKRTDPAAGTEAWAMIAGCLGNMNNRRRFTQALWLDDKPKPKRHEPTGSSTSRMPADAADPGQRGLRAILKEYEDEPSAPPWPDAVADFQAAVDNAQRLADERAQCSICSTTPSRSTTTLSCVAGTRPRRLPSSPMHGIAWSSGRASPPPTGDP